RQRSLYLESVRGHAVMVKNLGKMLEIRTAGHYVLSIAAGNRNLRTGERSGDEIVLNSSSPCHIDGHRGAVGLGQRHALSLDKQYRPWPCAGRCEFDDYHQLTGEPHTLYLGDGRH